MMAVFIEPHEKREAIDAYRDRLTPAQIETIEDAPDGARVAISFGGDVARVTVIPPG